MDLATRQDRDGSEGEATSPERELEDLLESAFDEDELQHFIRTRLTVIVGFAEAIREEVDASASLNDRLGTYAEQIESSGWHLLDTLNSILLLACSEMGRLSLSLGALDLTEETEAVGEALTTEAREAGVQLRVQAPDAPLRGRANRSGLRRVLRTLLRRMIREGTPGSTVDIQVHAADDAAAIGMKVLRNEDASASGTGGDGPLVSGEQPGGNRGQELGLALAVSRRLIGHMGGSLSVDTTAKTAPQVVLQLAKV